VVIGEKNIPTVAHADHKRRPKWVPGALGTAGTPCPGGYKYGGLTLRVGVWATAGQPVTLKEKPTLSNTKLWPRNSQAEWNRPMQSKQVLKSAKLQIGKEVKNRAVWEKPFRGRRSAWTVVPPKKKKNKKKKKKKQGKRKKKKTYIIDARNQILSK
jgi:hypothetical protein